MISVEICRLLVLLEIVNPATKLVSPLEIPLPGVYDVPKTDACGYALLFAFRNVDGVAGLMQEEGVGVLE